MANHRETCVTLNWLSLKEYVSGLLYYIADYKTVMPLSRYTWAFKKYLTFGREKYIYTPGGLQT